MKKILSRIFKLKPKSKPGPAPSPVVAHEIALKHATTRQRLQAEEIDAAEEKPSLRNLDSARKVGRRERAELRKGRADRGEQVAHGLMEGHGKKTKQSIGKEGKTTERDEISAASAGKARKAKPRKGSSFL